MAEAPEAVQPPEFTGAAPSSAPAAKPKREPIREWSTQKVLRTLRKANMLNGVAMIVFGILGFLNLFFALNITTVTINIYIMFFGLLLTCLECNFSNLAPKFRRNFGFMFSFLGRIFFIFFSGTMCFASDSILGYIIGAVTMVNALFNGYIVCMHPAFRRGGELSGATDPYKAYTGGASEMLNYIKSNPTLVKKAGAIATNFAAANPQVVMSVASAAPAGSGTGAAKSDSQWA